MYLRNKVGKFVHEMVLASLTFERIYNTMNSIIRRTVNTDFVKTLSHNIVDIKNTKTECTFVHSNVNDNEMWFTWSLWYCISIQLCSSLYSIKYNMQWLMKLFEHLSWKNLLFIHILICISFMNIFMHCFMYTIIWNILKFHWHCDERWLLLCQMCIACTI